MRLTARCAVFACASLLTVEALAAVALVKYKDWDQSPEAVYLATDEEKKAWKSVATDEEAEKFLKLFWAKRDPDLKTPANEYRIGFDARVAQGDTIFTIQGRKRGALTERGKILAILGSPKDILRETGNAGAVTSAPVGGAESTFGSSVSQGQSMVLRFKYEALAANDGKPTDVRVDMDRLGNERVLDSATVKKLVDKTVAAVIVNPKLTQETLPVYVTREEFAKQQQTAAEAAADAAKGPAFEAPLRAQLEKILAGEADDKVTVFVFAYRDGATRAAIQAFLPGGGAAGTRWAILARTKEGKDALRKLEPATLGKLKTDGFADVSLALDPGTYDLAVMLIDAAGAATLESKQAVTVGALPAEFDSSRLLVAATDLDATGAKPEDPFVVSGRKFVTKPAGLTTLDGLSYAVRIYNPTIDPSGKLWLKRKLSIKPKGKPEMDIPSAPDEPTPAPVAKDGAVVVDIAGAVIDADLGKYFDPGEFELRLVLVDGFAPAGAKPLTMKAPFRIVAAAGGKK